MQHVERVQGSISEHISTLWDLFLDCTLYYNCFIANEWRFGSDDLGETQLVKPELVMYSRPAISRPSLSHQIRSSLLMTLKAISLHVNYFWKQPNWILALAMLFRKTILSVAIIIIIIIININNIIINIISIIIQIVTCAMSFVRLNKNYKTLNMNLRHGQPLISQRLAWNKMAWVCSKMPEVRVLVWCLLEDSSISQSRRSESVA